MTRIPETQAQVKAQTQTEEDLRVEQSRVEHVRIVREVIRGD
jgi:hypothetical protein